MASPIIKKIIATRVKYSIVNIVDGVPVLEAQPDAIFRGIWSADRVKKALAKQLGDAQFIVVAVDAAEHRYAMAFEDFIRGADIVDEDSGAESGDDEDGGDGEADETEAAEDAEAAGGEDCER